jgi:hypothetical protein
MFPISSFKSINVMSSLLEVATNLSEILVTKISIMRMRINSYIETTFSFNDMSSLTKMFEDWFSFGTFWEIFND